MISFGDYYLTPSLLNYYSKLQPQPLPITLQKNQSNYILPTKTYDAQGLFF